MHLHKRKKSRSIGHCILPCSPVTKELTEDKYNHILQKGHRKGKSEFITDYYQKGHIKINLDTGLSEEISMKP